MEENPNRDKIKELERTKRELMAKMKKCRKTLSKVRAEKKRVTEEISRLRSPAGKLSGMTAVEARKKVVEEIRSTTPADIYPPELEKEFDRIDRHSKAHGDRILDLGGTDDGDDIVGKAPQGNMFREDDLGIRDFSEEAGHDDI